MTSPIPRNTPATPPDNPGMTPTPPTVHVHPTSPDTWHLHFPDGTVAPCRPWEVLAAIVLGELRGELSQPVGDGRWLVRVPCGAVYEVGVFPLFRPPM